MPILMHWLSSYNTDTTRPRPRFPASPAFMTTRSHSRRSIRYSTLLPQFDQAGSKLDIYALRLVEQSDEAAAETASDLTAACTIKFQTIREAHQQSVTQLEQSLQEAKLLRQQRTAQCQPKHQTQGADKHAQDRVMPEGSDEVLIGELDTTFNQHCMEAIIAAQAALETLVTNAVAAPNEDLVVRALQGVPTVCSFVTCTLLSRVVFQSNSQSGRQHGRR